MKNENKSFSTALKILIPVLVVAAVVAVWMLKNAGDKNPSAETTAPGTADVSETKQGDFDLNADETLDVEALKAYKLPILIEFGAEWCEPCKYMKPIITALNSELRGRAIVKFVDTDKYWDIASRYEFEYIPTQLFINADGTPYNPPNAAELGLDLHYGDGGELLFTTHSSTFTKEELLTILADMGMK